MLFSLHHQLLFFELGLLLRTRTAGLCAKLASNRACLKDIMYRSAELIAQRR